VTGTLDDFGFQMREPIFEADFEDNAYGYRPRRSAVDAVKETHRLMCRGYTDVVDADVSKYFDTIPHSDLLKSVARRIVDRHVLWLIKLWLKAPVEERDGDGTRRVSGGKSNTCGTPQGGVVSPLLSVIYINRLRLFDGVRRDRCSAGQKAGACAGLSPRAAAQPQDTNRLDPITL
jgi:retron-type reverse transcriptase